MAILNQDKSYVAYSALTTYAVGDVIIYLSQLYKCKVISLNNVPTNTTYWSPLWTNSDKI